MTAAVVEGRLEGLDRMRGAAALLMVADHGLVAASVGGWWRLGPTRAALPLFCLVAGALGGGSWARRSRRVVQMGVAGVVVTATAGLVLGTGAPDVLLVLAFGVVVLEGLRQVGSAGLTVAVVALAAIQPVTWRFGTGYQVGTVLVLLWLGGLPGVRDELEVAGRRLPAWIGLAGRRPLTVYVVHLVALAVVVGVTRVAG
jgi:uncharacterized membrane protein